MNQLAQCQLDCFKKKNNKEWQQTQHYDKQMKMGKNFWPVQVRLRKTQIADWNGGNSFQWMKNWNMCKMTYWARLGMRTMIVTFCQIKHRKRNIFWMTKKENQLKRMQFVDSARNCFSDWQTWGKPAAKNFKKMTEWHWTKGTKMECFSKWTN